MSVYGLAATSTWPVGDVGSPGAEPPVAQTTSAVAARATSGSARLRACDEATSGPYSDEYSRTRLDLEFRVVEFGATGAQSDAKAKRSDDDDG